MILFVGEESTGYFVEEVAKSYQQTIQYTGFIGSTDELIRGCLAEKADYIIIDLYNTVLECNEISYAISKARNTAGNSVFVVLAQGYSPRSDLVTACRNAGVTNFLLSTSPGVLKRDLEKILDGETINPSTSKDTEEKTLVPSPENAFVRNSTINPGSESRTIAVAGILSRIGTTTQCFQILRYLQSQGKTACYIEFNNTGFLSALIYYYSVVQNDDGSLNFLKMRLYRNGAVESMYQENFDYYIYDYGVLKDLDRRLKASFLEKSKKIIVCGDSATELAAMQDVMREYARSGVDYIFSFISEADQSCVLTQMDSQADRVYFAPYTPDPFVFQSSSMGMYEKLLSIQKEESSVDPTVPAKKGGFFGWRKNKK